MGQKVNPNGFRIGITSTWDSNWYSIGHDYISKSRSDYNIRKMILDDLKSASVSRIIIERPSKKVVVNIHSARPGIVIGKKGVDIEKIRRKVETISNSETTINITEIRKPETVPEIIVSTIASQLEKRASFRRVLKRAVSSAMKLRVDGIRINVKGRLGGAEIARTEWYKEGRVPLHTMRANVRYAMGTARTMWGAIGIKVWVYLKDNIHKTSNKLVQ
jgi:small subunit ribosomal protein S3